MLIRPERPADFDAIQAVVRAAFGADLEAELVRAIRADACYRPQFAFVAVDGAADAERVVGHVMLDGCWIRSPNGDRPVTMLSPLAVIPARQRQGVGTALIQHALAAADEAGEPLVLLEGSPTYYGARGFEPATRHGVTMPLPDWAPPEAAQVKLLRAYDADDLGLRGSLIQPPPFEGLH